jgi:hypothetical protein
MEEKRLTLAVEGGAGPVRTREQGGGRRSGTDWRRRRRRRKMGAGFGGGRL